jgi:hypothetical protein
MRFHRAAAIAAVALLGPGRAMWIVLATLIAVYLQVRLGR